MRHLLLNLANGIWLMTIIGLQSAHVHANVKDEAKVQTIIESVGGLADLGDFDTLQTLHDDEVLLDYASLTGQEAALLSSQTLMTQWASVLPGFDVTKHYLSDINVKFDKDHAFVTANVVADHFVGDLYWQVSGKYQYQLIRKDGTWKITHHTFLLKDEKGTRDVFSAAIERATQSPNTYIERQQSLNTVKRFLLALEEENLLVLDDVWHDDGVQDMPESLGKATTRLIGKDRIVRHYQQWFNRVDTQSMSASLQLYPMKDAQMVFAQWEGRFSGGMTMPYSALFHIEGGKITMLREYLYSGLSTPQ